MKAINPQAALIRPARLGHYRVLSVEAARSVCATGAQPHTLCTE